MIKQRKDTDVKLQLDKLWGKVKTAFQKAISLVLSKKKEPEVTPRNLLIKARGLIESGDCSFLCIALSEVGRKMNKIQEADRVRNHISVLIDCPSLEGGFTITAQTWLYHNHYEFLQQLKEVHGADAMKVYRLAWIDHMLANDEFFSV